MYLDINKGFGLMQAVQGWLISNKDAGTTRPGSAR